MEATVGIYHDHDKAINAVKHLVKVGIDEKEISLIGTGQVIEDHLHVSDVSDLKKAPVPVGAVAGGVLGVLAGAGMLAVPGLGFLFLAGKFVGALGGITMGMAAGGLTSFLVSIGFKEDQVVTYEKHLKDGKFLVVINGPKEHIDLANKELHHHDDHHELH